VSPARRSASRWPRCRRISSHGRAGAGDGTRVHGRGNDLRDRRRGRGDGCLLAATPGGRPARDRQDDPRGRLHEDSGGPAAAELLVPVFARAASTSPWPRARSSACPASAIREAAPDDRPPRTGRDPWPRPSPRSTGTTPSGRRTIRWERGWRKRASEPGRAAAGRPRLEGPSHPASLQAGRALPAPHRGPSTSRTSFSSAPATG
jgi:hypothetical protein